MALSRSSWARSVLLVKRTDAFQVAFGLEGHGLVLVQLGPGLIGACLIELGVDDKQGLPFADIGTLFEHHLFEEALDPGSDLDELLGADASDVFAVEFDIVGLDGLDFDHGPDGFCGFGTQPPPQPSAATTATAAMVIQVRLEKRRTLPPASLPSFSARRPDRTACCRIVSRDIFIA